MKNIQSAMDNTTEVNNVEKEFQDLDKNGAWTVAYQVCWIDNSLLNPFLPYFEY